MSFFFLIFFAVMAPLDHNYIETSSPLFIDCEKHDSATQTSLTMEHIQHLEELERKFQDPEKLMRDMFVEKVTRDDQSVMQYTGLPNKKMLKGFFSKCRQL